MTDTDTNGVVTGKMAGRKRWLALSRPVIVVVIALIVIALSIIGVLLSRDDTAVKSKTPAVQAVAVPPVTSTSKADALAQSGDYAGAQKALEAEQTKVKDSKDRAALYLSQATIAMNAENYNDARTYAAAADRLTPTANTAALLGSIAAAAGDKAAAKVYYDQAIGRLNKKADNYNISLSDYKTRIEELQ